MKKRVGLKKEKVDSKNKNYALSGAMRDLQTEIRKLGKEKSQLKEELGNVSQTLDVDRVKERELQEQFASIVEKEARLNERKKNLQTKIDNISNKMVKMSKIKSEMSDV